MSKNKSLRLPPDLGDAVEIRADQLGYRNFTAYVLGLIRYDMMVQGGHTVTLPLSNAKPADLDRLDAELLERCRTGKGIRGQWLEKVIAEIAGENAPAVAKKLPKGVIPE
jgi:hypothetical protein